MLSNTTKTILVNLYINNIATTKQLLSEFRNQNNSNGVKRNRTWGQSLLASPNTLGWGNNASLIKRGLVRVIGKVNKGGRVFTLTAAGVRVAKSLL